MDEQEQLRLQMEMEEEEEAEAAAAKPAPAKAAESGFGDTLVSEKPSATQAGILGAAQGASYGLFDELTGGLAAIKEAGDMTARGLGLAPPLDPQDDIFAEQNPATGAGVLDRMGSAYRQERDAVRRNTERSAEANPKLALASNIGGALLAPGPKGAGAGKTAGAGVLAKAKELGKAGAKLGAAYGLGTSDADLTKGEFWKALGDTLKGGAAGGVGGTVLGGASAKLQPWLKKLAAKRAMQSLSPSAGTLEKLKKMSPAKDPQAAARDIGQRALDEGVVVPFGTSQGAAQRVANKLDETGELKTAMLQSIQDQAAGPTRVSYPDVAARLEAAAQRAKLSSAEAPLSGHLINQAKLLRDTGAERARQLGQGRDVLSLMEAEAEKTAMQQKIREAAADYLKKGSPKLEAQRRAAQAMREATEAEAERVAGPEAAAQFGALKKRYGSLAELAKVAQRDAGKDMMAGGALGRSEMADAIASRQSSHGPSHGLQAYLFNHAKDALRNAVMERRPATMAHAYKWLGNANVGGAPSRAMSSATPDLSEYLRALRGDDEGL